MNCKFVKEMLSCFLLIGVSVDDLDLHRASIATEIHFLYTSDTTNIDELFSPDSKSQMGLGKQNSLSLSLSLSLTHTHTHTRAHTHTHTFI